MEALPVTLVVKAPNQQIEDQTVKCELSWTINKLKQHLSEVYPSKPPKHEQRLIYSGQLLSDSACLKDVLRQYDGQEVHTVHLVCVSRNDPSKSQNTSYDMPNKVPKSTNTSPEVTPTTSGASATQQVPNFQFPNATQFANYSQMDPNQYALHMAWMQQAYLQYMMQYMNSAANANNFNPTTTTTVPPTENVNQRAEAPQPAAVPAEAPRDPDAPERDWLDAFYMLSRMLVLFSIVYFYSNPLRFIIVLILGIGFYLYQIGFFRNFANNNNNNTPVDQQNLEEHSPSVLTIVWTFFTTFFASLIPEIPNAV